jgi:hypothetical protein
MIATWNITHKGLGAKHACIYVEKPLAAPTPQMGLGLYCSRLQWSSVQDVGDRNEFGGSFGSKAFAIIGRGGTRISIGFLFVNQILHTYRVLELPNQHEQQHQGRPWKVCRHRSYQSSHAVPLNGPRAP